MLMNKSSAKLAADLTFASQDYPRFARVTNAALALALPGRTLRSSLILRNSPARLHP
ncbi:hypothetical protein [Bradyrhizobium barranii]|uniref:Uncharacterized protein n=1 Tax=Bradyrhizobium barranii subsp. apii TaxID=2819348 RepID=A0A8T5VAI6_9BRAD|nr:hypothetical protein [Bradyrhizobium barranii]UPT91185.1 hypothetical protein HAP41_0000021030 [Bradyrhizobium barranii subsp. apii]UPT94140.1 hypothetical protein J4G48_0033125 [Bradyrhizobium barranii subsp. apii]